MRTYTWKCFVLFALGSLVGCVQSEAVDPGPPSIPPNDVSINVYFNDEGCPIKTQTSSNTCRFVGKSDPVDTACQKRSPDEGRRTLSWKTVANKAAGDVEFTLEFSHGDPLKSTTTGRCKLATASSGFTCLVRRKNEPPPLDWVYKYDVVVNAGEENECRLDPRVYLMR
jgi:hypothetical protein